MEFLKDKRKLIIPIMGAFIAQGAAFFMGGYSKHTVELEMPKESVQSPVQTEDPEVPPEPVETEGPEVLPEPVETEGPEVPPEPVQTEESEVPPEPVQTEDPEIQEDTKQEKSAEETDVSQEHICSFRVEEREATCLTAGSVTEKCIECGSIRMEKEIGPLGHDFEKSIWETATCLKGGYSNNICQRCGLTESVSEEPLPHDVEDIVVREGNCMEDTIIRHICKICGEQVEGDTRYSPQIHNWTKGMVDGVEVMYCEWCGVVQE